MFCLEFDLYGTNGWINTVNKWVSFAPTLMSWIVYDEVKYQVIDIVMNLDKETTTIKCQRY